MKSSKHMTTALEAVGNIKLTKAIMREALLDAKRSLEKAQSDLNCAENIDDALSAVMKGLKASDRDFLND